MKVDTESTQFTEGAMLHGGGGFGLIDGQGGGGVPGAQFLGDGAGVVRGAAQTDHAGSAAQGAAQGTGGIAFLAVGEHFRGDHRIGEAHPLAQGHQQGLGSAIAAAVLEIALIAQLFHLVQVKLGKGEGMRGGDGFVLGQYAGEGRAAHQRGTGQQHGGLFQKITAGLQHEKNSSFNSPYVAIFADA